MDQQHQKIRFAELIDCLFIVAGCFDTIHVSHFSLGLFINVTFSDLAL
jgi:hypothetical protein